MPNTSVDRCNRDMRKHTLVRGQLVRSGAQHLSRELFAYCVGPKNKRGHVKLKKAK